MRVLALTHPVTVPSVRFRFLPIFPVLEKDGIRVERLDVPSSLWKRWAILRRVSGFDAVLHVKRLIPGWQVDLLRRRARRLVYDFDDPMPYGRKGGRIMLSRTRVGRFRRILGAADVVVTHNSGFAQLAKEYGARRVEIVPMSADLGRYLPRQGPGDGSRIGWLGTSATLSNLREIAPALEGRTLILVADEPLELPGVKVEFVPWSLEGEPAQIRALDIAIAPISDDPWAVGKLPMKVIHYMAAGLPVLASRRGAVETILRHGENGLLASTVEEWREALSQLSSDEELRLRLGRAARETIERGHTVEIAAARWKKILTG